MALPSQLVKLPGIKTVIGVLSGKGGVGKSFVASSLALTMAKSGLKVGIFDADISCPNLFKIFGITDKLKQTTDNKVMPIEKWGVKVISMVGLCVTEDEPIVWRGPILSKIISQLISHTIWGSLDVLVIDFPSGTSDAVLTLLQNFAVDGVLVVTTPQSLSTMDARRTIKMADMIKVPVLGIIENMRGDVFGEGGGSRTAEAFRLPFLGSIPMKKQIVSMCDQGTPAIFQVEELEMIFTKMARMVLEKIIVE